MTTGLPSTDKSSFSRTPSHSIPRSTFRRNHGYKTTFDVDYLVPFFVDEALPGDFYDLQPTIFARINTFKFPIFDNIHFSYWFFFVPNRLVWDNADRMIFAYKPKLTDTTDFLVPQVNSPTGGHAEGSLFDYFGVPTGVDQTTCNALIFRSYNKINNDYFRAQFLEDDITIQTDDGPDNYLQYNLVKRNKRFNYFTACNPFPQAGNPVTIPLSGDAPVRGISFVSTGSGSAARAKPGISDLVSGTFVTTSNAYIPGDPPAGSRPVSGLDAGFSQGYLESVLLFGTTGSGTITRDPTSPRLNVYADLSAVSAISVNQLRQAFQIQKILECDARSGTRPQEALLSQWGVNAKDARLDRAELMHHGRSELSVVPIAQTSQTSPQSPQANLSAYGVMSHTCKRFGYYIYEHGWVIGLIQAHGDITYQQGMPRSFTRRKRFDFAHPILAHIGEQAVLNKEIYYQGPSALDPNGNPFDDEVFGYNERFAEYKYKPSQVTGKMRSNAQQSLDVWHLAEDFGTLPKLNSTFIKSNTPMDRVVSIPSQPDFLLDVYFKFNHTRALPGYGVPGWLDHF